MPTLCTTADKAVAALIGAQDVSIYNDHTANTKKTYMFRKTLELKELACRLCDTAIVLREHCTLMRDVNATDKNKRVSITNIRTVIEPGICRACAIIFGVWPFSAIIICPRFLAFSPLFSVIFKSTGSSSCGRSIQSARC